MQQSAQSTFQQNDTTTSANTMMEQSNIAGNVHSVDHSETFMKCMNMYQITGSNQEHEGFKIKNDVAIGIDHYEHYSELLLQ